MAQHPVTPRRSVDAEEALIRANLPLVQYGVAEITGRVPRHVSRDDLVSAAMYGLAQAARSWDDTRGIAFEKFAMIRIRGALLDELRSRDWASRSVRASARKMDAATDAFTARHGRTPTLEETAAEMGTDVDRVQNIVDDVHRGTVLNYESLVSDGSIADVLPDTDPTPLDELLGRERKAYLMDAIVALPERLRHVVVGYFFEERPMQEIADELGVSESRISQMRGEALALLHAGITANLDPDMLPAEPRPAGRLAKKKAAYYAAVATNSTTTDRLTATPTPLAKRLAMSA
ncbi:sigma-70 family RNA polymerase sigma factor [Euzebya sp.]|uniref:sigma-70 family RNA polymerase sigma factor n=1 Tax=Euzebya sp. TaxID=1971409 RepID=UPI0035137129